MNTSCQLHELMLADCSIQLGRPQRWPMARRGGERRGEVVVMGSIPNSWPVNIRHLTYSIQAPLFLAFHCCWVTRQCRSPLIAVSLSTVWQSTIVHCLQSWLWSSSTLLAEASQTTVHFISQHYQQSAIVWLWLSVLLDTSVLHKQWKLINGSSLNHEKHCSDYSHAYSSNMYICPAVDEHYRLLVQMFINCILWSEFSQIKCVKMSLPVKL